MLTGQRDANLEILKNLDDRDLLSFCQVNKYTNNLCKDEYFWRNRFIKEHGRKIYEEAMKYKSSEKTWRKFYLSIVHYWNKAEDNNFAMNGAAKEGHKDLVEFFIEKGANDWNAGMNGAARGGHKDLVEFFISKGADDWNYGMWGAAKGGHKDLVNFFILKGADNWDGGMSYAALGGHKELVNFFISKGANNWSEGMYFAAEGAHKDLVEFFKQKMNSQR